MAHVEYGIAVLFAKRATIRRNVPYFHGKSAAILAKVLQSRLRTFRSVAHTEGCVAHGTSC